MYGLPQLLKQYIPFTPILQKLSPTAQIGQIPKFFIIVHFNLLLTICWKDSFEVIERIKNIKSENTVLTSFDVKQLFSNVPLKESIKVSVDKLHEIKKTKLEKIND